MRRLLALLILPLILAPAVPALAQGSAPTANVTTAPTAVATAPAQLPAVVPVPVTTPVTVPTTTTTTTVGAPTAPTGGVNAASDPLAIVLAGAVLIKLFVLSAILESALALLFNWGPIVRTFNGKGVKPLVSFGVALALTMGFNSHLFAGLFAALSYDVTGPYALSICQILEAAVLAGGSSGVSRLLRNLGIRPIDPVAEQNPQPLPQDAWIAVRHHRVDARGTVDVELGTVAADGSTLWTMAGQIAGGRPLTGFASWLLRDRSRFPGSGGYVVPPGVPLAVRLAWTKPDGTVLMSPVWGPYALAERAIMDIDLTL